MSQPTVAVLGASQDRSKYGNKSVRAHLAQGYQVFPVNPREEMIEGLTCYATLADVPVKPLDRISIYLPPQVGLKLLPEIQQAGAKEVWFNPGSESPEILQKAQELGLNPILACSIVDVGRMPTEFGDTDSGDSAE